MSIIDDSRLLSGTTLRVARRCVLLATLGCAVIGCVPPDAPTQMAETESGDEAPSADTDVLQDSSTDESGLMPDLGSPDDSTSAETGDGDDGGDGDGDGDGDDGNGEGICGDGVLDPNEACDTAVALVIPCPGPGLSLCRADCTLDDSFCDCPLGSVGCLCNAVGGCDEGLECVGNGPHVCEPLECFGRGERCLAVIDCCLGLNCVEGDPGEFTCQ